MAIRSADIRRKEFKNRLRGYDANEVDDFLDEVADELEQATSENARLREESSGLRSRLEQFDELEGSIRAALVHAEQAANDLRRTATREAESVRQTANREAELTVNDAKDRSHRMLADTSERVERIRESYEAMRHARQLFASDFRHLLKSYLEVMDNADVTTASEIEASLRGRVDPESMAAARLAAGNASLQEELPVEEAQGEASSDGGQDLAPSQAVDETDERDGDEEPVAEEPAADETPEEDASPAQETSSQDETVARDPEVEEPEVEPSTAGDTPEEEPADGEGSSREASGTSSLAQESGSNEFWEDAERRNAAENSTGDGDENSRVSRASRFLRRRG